jgi:aspartyl/glutamyl-tRNA(Asn/Gln) amidotransferase C subunit
MQLEDIKKLAELARVDMSDAEMSEMAHDFDGILAYVSQVQEAVKLVHEDSADFASINVSREDIQTNRGGEYTSKIIEQFPDQKDGYLKVKQIL